MDVERCVGFVECDGEAVSVVGVDAERADGALADAGGDTGVDDTAADDTGAAGPDAPIVDGRGLAAHPATATTTATSGSSLPENLTPLRRATVPSGCDVRQLLAGRFATRRNVTGVTRDR